MQRASRCDTDGACVCSVYGTAHETSDFVCLDNIRSLSGLILPGTFWRPVPSAGAVRDCISMHTFSHLNS